MPNYDNIKRGDYETSKGTIYFRSLWEANYALYLDFLMEQGEIEDWEYEPERYDFIGYEGNKPFVVGPGYLPDFRVTRKDGTQYLVEIKGRKQGTRKLSRMKKYHPEIKVELVGASEYNTLKRQVGKLLNFY